MSLAESVGFWLILKGEKMGDGHEKDRSGPMIGEESHKQSDLHLWNKGFISDKVEDRPFRILLADDEHTLLLSTAELLRREGLDCICAENAEGVKKLLATEDIDVVVADYKMPGNEKMELLNTATVPVIIITGYPSLQSAITSVQREAFDYVTKPLDMDYLVRRIKEAAEQHRMDEALRQSEQRYRALAELSPDAILLHQDGHIVYVNAACARLLGASAPRDIVGSVTSEVIQPKVNAARNSVKGEECSFEEEDPQFSEHTMLRKDGAPVEVEAASARLFYEGHPAILIVARDVTERKRQQNALRRRDLILQAVAYAAGRFLRDGDWEAAMDHILERLGVALGVDRVSILENTAGEAKHLVCMTRHSWALDPQDRYRPGEDELDYSAEGFSAWRELLRQGQVVHGLTAELGTTPRDALSQRRTRSIALVPIFDGPHWWGVFSFEDCHNDRVWFSAEVDALSSAASMLGAAITHRRTLQERENVIRNMLQAQKLESLGNLAGGIAHDFNNLLMAVLGNTDLVLYDLPTDHGLREYLEEARLAARRAADLSMQMLTYAGQGKFVLEPASVPAVIRSIEGLLRASAPMHITIEYRIGERVPLAEVDQAQLRQLVINLVTNAAEAIGSEKGAIRISVDEVALSADDIERSIVGDQVSPGSFVRLRVADSGTGMDAVTCERAFDPFYTTKFNGRGLGLSVVLGIIRGHQGVLMVDSRPGKGTNIAVLFRSLE